MFFSEFGFLIEILFFVDLVISNPAFLKAAKISSLFCICLFSTCCKMALWICCLISFILEGKFLVSIKSCLFFGEFGSEKP